MKELDHCMQDNDLFFSKPVSRFACFATPSLASRASLASSVLSQSTCCKSLDKHTESSASTCELRFNTFACY